MGVALAVLGTVAQGVASYNESKAQARQYEAQAQQAVQNAAIAERQREQEGYRSLQERRQIVSRANEIQGANNAGFAAAGIQADSGSVLDLARASIDARNQDLETNAYNLGLTDLGLRQSIANDEASARSFKSAAKTTKRAGLLSSILGTATSLYGLRSSSKANPGSAVASGAKAKFDSSYYTGGNFDLANGRYSKGDFKGWAPGAKQGNIFNNSVGKRLTIGTSQPKR